MPRDFEYRPKIAYPKKRAVPAESSAASAAQLMEEPYAQLMVRPLADELAEAMEAVDKALLAAEDRLGSLMVQIDPNEEPDVAEAIKHFCVLNSNADGVIYNDSIVNLPIVRRACMDIDHPLAASLLDKWFAASQEENGDVAGELYEALWRVRHDLVGSCKLAGSFVFAGLTGVEVSVDQYGRFAKDDLARACAAEEAVVARRRQLVSGFVGARMESELDAGAVYETKTALADIDVVRKSMFDVCDAVREQAAGARDVAERAYRIIQSGMYESLGDSACCLLRRIVNGLDTSSIDGLNGAIDRTISFLKSARTLLRVRFDSRILDMASTRGVLVGLRASMINTIANTMMSTMQQVLTKLAMPVVNGIDNLVRDAHADEETCIPLETIGGTLMDAVEYVLAEYTESVMDRLRLNMSFFASFDKMLGVAEEKQRSRNIMKLFDDLIVGLESWRARLDIKDDIAATVEEFMREHGLDTFFDPTTGTRGRLDSLCN